MPNHIEEINISGLFGRFDLQKVFSPGVNVIYGKNGGGKTILLHILANALNGDYERFAFLDFRSIEIKFNDCKLFIKRFREEMGFNEGQGDLQSRDTIINIFIDGESVGRFSVSEIEKFEPSLHTRPIRSKRAKSSTSEPLLSTTYIPAFRAAIDAWKAISEIYATNEKFKNRKTDINNKTTEFLRQWLLPFVPSVYYPSLEEIEQELESSSIQSSNKIDHFLNGVHSFLEDKRITFNQSEDHQMVGKVEISYSDGTKSKGLRALSSGERQILMMIYALTIIDSSKVILLDEPEISLHVDWQRILLEKLSSQLKDKQIIACTHSPIIGADYDDFVTELNLTKFNDNNFSNIEDEELPY
jgi:predicted ATP-binding protein involved in virulence